MDVFTGNRYCKDLGIQSLATAGCTGNDGKILLVFLTLAIGGRFFIAMHYRFANTLPFNEPVGFATVDGHVIHADLLVRSALHHDFLNLPWNIFPRGVGAHVVMLKHRPHNLRVIVARPKRRNCAFGKRKRLIGNHQARINLFATTDAQAIGTRTVRRIE